MGVAPPNFITFVLEMYVRRKPNRSGSTSVVVVAKSRGKLRYLATIGTSSDEGEIVSLCHQGKDWIKGREGQGDLFVAQKKADSEKQQIESLLSNVKNILPNGIQLLLEKVYRSVGFDAIEDTILRQLVIARLSQPMSKSGTVEYLKSHFDEDIDLSKIYRYLDKLYNTQQAKIQQISVEHTRRILGGVIGIVFYDVTTLYFETDYGDDLRATGYSKDGKHNQPQIVLGLLVSRDGYPLNYSIFNGSQYEGRTMIPIIDDFVVRFNLKEFVVVADSGLMNAKNISLLESAGYKYIIGARIKNESEEIKRWILSRQKQDGEFYEMNKTKTCRLIINYSDKRAKKDAYNRDKGVKRLKRDYGSGKISKENINKRGYNKFLEIKDDVSVSINESKITDDAQWDGLKGYITNTALEAKTVCEQYKGLWVVERAYRVTKGTIELRPMFHFTPRRIEAHVCICFVAYKIYKELERLLKANQVNMSVDKVLDVAKTIATISIQVPLTGETITKTMFLTRLHKLIEPLFRDDFYEK